MKKILIPAFCLLLFSACSKLDLSPLSEGSTENWYTNETEVTLALNDLYRTYLWAQEMDFQTERLTDNWTQRQVASTYATGAIASDWAFSGDIWANTYKGITRANTVINSVNRMSSIPQAQIQLFLAEAYFFRAVYYSRLIFHYGDVPYYTSTMTIEQAFAIGRTSKATILQEIYKDFDKAIADLPVSYTASQQKRATKGAAMAFKARIALYMGDWATARDAAKACIDLKTFSLYPDYREYFLSKTKNTSETIFSLPQSTTLGQSWASTNFYPRTAGGSAVAQPSWELLCAYPCKDGLPIDESPLYNPRNPFANRDPRCANTIVEFGTEFLGVIYDPNPYTTTVLKTSTNTKVANKDTRSVDQFAAYNGLALKKWVDEDWLDNKAEFEIIIMRYADVLLMYAEARAELNEVDASALLALNTVRARAYKADVAATSSYPAVTTTDQKAFRKIVRNERRIELAWENRRLDDLIRWRLAEKVLTKPIYGLLDPNDLKTKVVDKGLWFFPGVPDIDEDWLPDFTAMYNTGNIKLLVQRNYDKTKEYLWPIPAKERLINKNLTQNDNY